MYLSSFPILPSKRPTLHFTINKTFTAHDGNAGNFPYAILQPTLNLDESRFHTGFFDDIIIVGDVILKKGAIILAPQSGMESINKHALPAILDFIVTYDDTQQNCRQAVDERLKNTYHQGIIKDDPVVDIRKSIRPDYEITVDGKTFAVKKYFDQILNLPIENWTMHSYTAYHFLEEDLFPVFFLYRLFLSKETLVNVKEMLRLSHLAGIHNESELDSLRNLLSDPKHFESYTQEIKKIYEEIENNAQKIEDKESEAIKDLSLEQVYRRSIEHFLPSAKKFLLIFNKLLHNFIFY